MKERMTETSQNETEVTTRNVHFGTPYQRRARKRYRPGAYVHIALLPRYRAYPKEQFNQTVQRML